MWTEIPEFIEKVSQKENLDELMSLYLIYVVPLRKRVKQCDQYKIALDIIKITDIRKKYEDNEALETISREKFESPYISSRIKENRDNIIGIDNLIKDEKKNIELIFILKNIENFHDYELIKHIIAFLVAIFSILFTSSIINKLIF